MRVIVSPCFATALLEEIDEKILVIDHNDEGSHTPETVEPGSRGDSSLSCRRQHPGANCKPAWVYIWAHQDKKLLERETPS